MVREADRMFEEALVKLNEGMMEIDPVDEVFVDEEIEIADLEIAEELRRF